MKKYSLFLLVIFVFCFCTSRSTENARSTLADAEKEVLSFIYHRFGDSRYPSTNVPLKDFESHLDYLKRNNFQVLTFSAAIHYLQSDAPVRKTAVITIDDGYKSFYRSGLPLLKKYGFPATLFINTKTVGGGDYMTWSELKEVVKNNIEIGNHTHSHDFFLNQSLTSRYQTFKQEIEQSQSTISDQLGVTPRVFSYPYGEFDSKMKDIVKSSGFLAAAAQNSGVIHTGTDLFECPRFPMSESYSSAEKFAEKALAMALKVVSRSPDDYILPESKQPLLTLTVENTNLRFPQFQCFVQGGECDLHVLSHNEKEITVTVQARKPISGRRRTLYTITVPDAQGNWHWYSHLWINSKVD